MTNTQLLQEKKRLIARLNYLLTNPEMSLEKKDAVVKALAKLVDELEKGQ